jgi:hypothetical protein
MEAWELTAASAGVVARENFIRDVPANRMLGFCLKSLVQFQVTLLKKIEMVLTFV